MTAPKIPTKPTKNNYPTFVAFLFLFFPRFFISPYQWQKRQNSLLLILDIVSQRNNIKRFRQFPTLNSCEYGLTYCTVARFPSNSLMCKGYLSAYYWGFYGNDCEKRVRKFGNATRVPGFMEFNTLASESRKHLKMCTSLTIYM